MLTIGTSNDLCLFHGLFEGCRFKIKRAPFNFKALYLILAMISVLLIYAGCSSSWSPSDEEAVQLVKGYYLYYHDGKDVDAEVIERGEYIKECKCYPIKLRVVFSENRSQKKTFYFFENKSGNVDVREYRFGIK